MNRFILPVITTSALIFGFILPSEKTTAQTTAKDLVGTWTLVSLTLEQDGKKTDFYGPNPKGQRTYDPSGRFSEIITRADLPKFASNNRQAAVRSLIGTGPSENILSTSPGTNSMSRLSLRRPPVREPLTRSGSAPSRYRYTKPGSAR